MALPARLDAARSVHARDSGLARRIRTHPRGPPPSLEILRLSDALPRDERLSERAPDSLDRPRMVARSHRRRRLGINAVRPQIRVRAGLRSAVLQLLRPRPDHRFHRPLDDLRRPDDDRVAHDRRDRPLRRRPALRRVADRRRRADQRRLDRDLDAKHVAGRVLRRRLSDLVLEALGALRGAAAHRRDPVRQSVRPSRASSYRRSPRTAPWIRMRTARNCGRLAGR